MHKFINSIFICLTFLVLVTIVSEASPLHRRQNNTLDNTQNGTLNNTQNGTLNNTQNGTLDNTQNGTLTNTQNSTQGNTQNSTQGNSQDNTQSPASQADIGQFNIWVKYAGAAYCNVTGWNCGEACSGVTAGTRLIKFFTRSVPNDNNGYVAINDQQKAIIVAYRGTEDVQSFLDDTEFVQAPFNNPNFTDAKVHLGFLATYNNTRQEITSLVQNLVQQNPGYMVISTGHSLGGALSIFQTLDLIGTPGLNPSNLITYTYGQPRVGNQAFVDLVQSTGFPFFRVVNKNDLVPHIPPQGLLQYEHFGPEFWIEPSNDIVECPNAEETACSNSQIPNLSILSHINYLDTAFVFSCLDKQQQ